MSFPANLAAMHVPNREALLRRVDGELVRARASLASSRLAASVGSVGADARPTPAETPRIGWVAADLTAILEGLGDTEQPTILQREDGAGLVYPGRLHWLSGEPETGKDWLCRVAERGVILSGGAVLMLDYEDTAEEFVRRHDTLATPLDDLVERATYIRPETPASLAAIEPLAAQGFALVVVSGVNAAIALQGGNPNEAVSISAWTTVAIRPFLLAGAAVIVSDHVNKDPDSRGRWATGSGHKLATADVGLKAVAVEDARFTPGRGGRVLLYLTKDRRGQLRAIAGAKDLLAEFVLEPNPDGSLTAILRPPGDRAAFRPTVLMERVSKFLETGGERSSKAIESGVSGKADYIRDAVRHLVDGGFVSVRPGPTGGKLHASVNPFREAERTGP